MTENTVNYKKSRKKQIIWGLTLFVILTLAGITMYPVNTPQKVIIFTAISLIFAGLVLWLVRKAAKEAICPHCNADIFELIETSKQTKVNFNFCPACGNEVKI